MYILASAMYTKCVQPKGCLSYFVSYICSLTEGIFLFF